ncbi:hypothetical protein CSUB01_07942 [Colletotrichum sublineola]|uniref:Uncharacterized protein n=1 Tax=Colletotrichum sublineola TaxID=1173701 RepID=A0A066XNI9_COLSU|nr:hypothetical protein CSUB01_07942 [Colletotrichum sublineola]
MWHPSASVTGNNKDVAFLVSDRGRIFNFSRLDVGNSLLLDGPYGRNLELWNYETVILAAKGMGIAGILSSALCLLDRRNQDSEAKKDKKRGQRLFRDLTRKVAIVWTLEDNAQEDWAAPAFSVLQGLDSDQTFLLVWCIYPSEQKKSAPFQLKDYWQCFYDQKGKEVKYINSLVSQDTRSPGRSIVVACGDSDFSHGNQSIDRRAIVFVADCRAKSHNGRRDRSRDPGSRRRLTVANKALVLTAGPIHHVGLLSPATWFWIDVSPCYFGHLRFASNSDPHPHPVAMLLDLGGIGAKFTKEPLKRPPGWGRRTSIYNGQTFWFDETGILAQLGIALEPKQGLAASSCPRAESQVSFAPSSSSLSASQGSPEPAHSVTHSTPCLDAAPLYPIEFGLFESDTCSTTDEWASPPREKPSVNQNAREAVPIDMDFFGLEEDGKQRIAAAEKKFGSEYWWTVRLYFTEGFQHIPISRQTQTLHQTQESDGDIYRELRGEQLANQLRTTQELQVQLSPCKEKILNQLLKRRPPDPNSESIIDVLDSLIPYPGLWEGLQIANWHRHLALHCDEQIIHFLKNRLRSTYEHIVKGVPDAQQYVDVPTVRCLALRCPSSKIDAAFIKKKMENRELFRGVTDAASRRQILENILSINIIIPSLKTFHENMKYFAIGAKIIRQHIMPDEHDPKSDLPTLPQRLPWSQPSQPTIEAANGRFLQLQALDSGLALKALFQVALTSFPYLSNDRPKQDARGEAMAAGVDAGFVYLLQRRARRLGFSSPKIESGLAGKQPVCRVLFDVPDRQVDSKWKCGKPGLRAFLLLQERAFLPDLISVNGADGLVLLFVFRDFMDAFFGCGDAFMADGPASEQPTADVSMVDTDTPTSTITRRSQLRTAPRRDQRRRWQPFGAERPTRAVASSSQVSPLQRNGIEAINNHPARLRQLTMSSAPSNTAVSGAVVTAGPIWFPGTANSAPVRRSLVAPPDLNPQSARAPKPKNGVKKKKKRPKSIVKSNKPAQAAEPSLPSTSQPPTSFGNSGSSTFAPLSSSIRAQEAESSLPFALQPQIAFTNTNNRSPVFAPAINERKRDSSQLDTSLRLRDWMTGAWTTDELPRKRLRSLTAPASTPDPSGQENAPIQAVPTRDATPQTVPSISPREDTSVQPSVYANDRPRSLVAAPGSGSSSPVEQQNTPHADLDEGIPTTGGPSAVTRTTASTTPNDVEEVTEGFYGVETFSQTRTQSPGSYEVDDWYRLGPSVRSPVATPESDL